MHPISPLTAYWFKQVLWLPLAWNQIRFSLPNFRPIFHLKDSAERKSLLFECKSMKIPFPLRPPLDCLGPRPPLLSEPLSWWKIGQAGVAAVAFADNRITAGNPLRHQGQLEMEGTLTDKHLAGACCCLSFKESDKKNNFVFFKIRTFKQKLGLPFMNMIISIIHDTP